MVNVCDTRDDQAMMECGAERTQGLCQRSMGIKVRVIFAEH